MMMLMMMLLMMMIMMMMNKARKVKKLGERENESTDNMQRRRAAMTELRNAKQKGRERGAEKIDGRKKERRHIYIYKSYVCRERGDTRERERERDLQSK